MMMKRIILTLMVSALLVFSVTATKADALEFSLEGVAFEFTNVDTPYAFNDINTSFPTTESFDHGFDMGIRAILGQGQNGWNLTYLNISSDEDESATDTNGNDIISTVEWPDDYYGTCNLCTVEATSEIDFTLFDIAYNNTFTNSATTNFYWTGGLRYFNFEHEIENDLISAGTNQQHIELSTESSGIGPMVGIGGNHEVSDVLSLNGQLDFSLLYGESEWDYFTDYAPMGTDSQRDSIVPMIGISFGLTYNLMKQLDLTAGYEFMHLSNIVTSQEFVDDVTQGRMVTNESSMGLHGASLGLRWTFGG